MRRLLLVKTGRVSPPVGTALGDYDRWFARSLTPGRCVFRIVEAHLGEPLPARAAGFDAVIVTGSPRSVMEREPWMRRAGTWLLEAAEHRVPVLGVCFGHQLLAETLGGRIRKSPRGREIGTVRCALTPAGRVDPLFDGVPPVFYAQATHEDEVAEDPPGVEILASSDASRVQAFGSGPFVRAVQFHPEIDVATMRAIAESRVRQLEREERERGGDPCDRVRAVLAGIRDAPHARRVLDNFLERFT